ncbi:hypothetical protein NA56DRAFT_700725 [Hyaloscypha hepaticicola]|uniref:Uncharacterized protein n=1 Tax=Hyaloscypha hepaticicola TaxID=2082293 RepID=A0A2J6QDA5_9HELO|nr:hypothetical protein NA56DRAFT_700725 [Hyaloscypha hepaticicola]
MGIDPRLRDTTSTGSYTPQSHQILLAPHTVQSPAVHRSSSNIKHPTFPLPDRPIEFRLLQKSIETLPLANHQEYPPACFVEPKLVQVLKHHEDDRYTLVDEFGGRDSPWWHSHNLFVFRDETVLDMMASFLDGLAMIQGFL